MSVNHNCFQIFLFYFLWCSAYFAWHLNKTYCSFATRVSQLKIWHFWVIGIERNIWRCTLNSYSVITQFSKLVAGAQLFHHCTHRRVQHFKIFKSFSWKISNFDLRHCLHKWAIFMTGKQQLKEKAGSGRDWDLALQIYIKGFLWL